MASFDIRSILGAPALTKAVYARTRGVPNPFPDSFFTTDPEDDVKDDYATFARYQGQRRTARLNARGNPSRTQQMLPFEMVTTKLLSTSENIVLPMDKYKNLISTDSTGSNLLIDEKGAQQIQRIVADMGATFMNLRIAAVAFCLATDNIYWDIGGNLLPNSTGNVFSITSGVPANNQGQLNGIISNTWNSSTTDIAGQLEALQQTASQLSGYPLDYAFYGKNVLSYVTNNANLVKYFQFNQSVNTQLIASNKIPNNVLDLNWSSAYTAQYDDQNGVTQSIWGNDLVTFTPDPAQSPGWFSFLQGTTYVPNEIGEVGSSGVDLLKNISPVTGMYAYCVVEHDPIRIKIVMGDCFLPVLKVPTSIFQAQTRISGC